jgi:FAD synthetase
MPEGSVNLRDRVRAYIENVRQALEQLKDLAKDGKAQKIVELAKSYVEDTVYYLEAGDEETALATISYAEGLLDALKWLGIADIEWKPLSAMLKRRRVLVAGTFDIIHPGHIELLKHAWRLGEVYVVVARDSNATKIKGRRPVVPEEQRLAVVSSLKYVSKAVLGSEKDLLEPITKIKPDYILLGPDQWAREEWLRGELAKRGLSAEVIRMENVVECPLCSSTKIACKAREVVNEKTCNSASR